MSDSETILNDVRELIKYNILPRLTDVEEELKSLRYSTWPICQNIKEHGVPLSDINSKHRFFVTGLSRDIDELKRLLSAKDALTNSKTISEEYRRIIMCENNNKTHE
jgi:hypothetical protein